MFLLSLGLLLTALATGQGRVMGDPDSAEIVTADIGHFWRAFDLLSKERTQADSLHVLQTVFIDPASEGLRQYIAAAHCTAQTFLDAIVRRSADYRAVRDSTLAVAGQVAVIRQYLRRFKRLYPGLRIPVICYAIGKFEVGGTQFDSILYIGCEVDGLHHVNVAAQSMHELAHFQQKDQNPQTNLELAMVEGGAEFVSFQVTGQRTIAAWRYGTAHETELWRAFRPQVDLPIDMTWFRDIPDNGRPGSLGYFIGFRICATYLHTCSDRKAALRAVIEMKNPKKLFLASGYTGYRKPPPR